MFQLAARKHADGTAVDNQTEQQFGVVRRLSRTTIAAGHKPQIQPPNDLHHKPREMSFRQPLVHRWRQQKAAVAVNRTEIAHTRGVQASKGRLAPNHTARFRVA
jgi:hypothetical protein